MKAYKVTWQTFQLKSGFAMGYVSHEDYKVIDKEKHFATQEAALAFIEKMDAALKLLNLNMVIKFPILHEVELE